jgi:hypothetical protein
VATPWRDPEFERDLRRLGRRARASVQTDGVFQLSPDLDFRSTRGVPLYFLDEDARALLRSLQRRLAGRARSATGLSPEEAREVLLTFCDEAVGATIAGAVTALMAEVAAAPREWVVAEPVAGVLATPRLVVGRTTYSDRLPRARRGSDAGALPPFASARVTARGYTTARVLARVAFAESNAILDLQSRRNHVGSEITYARVRGRPGGFNYQRSGWILGQFEGARLVSPYRQLSAAAARAEANRSDWQRRVLAATRWFSRAVRSDAADARLVAAMVALECLFVDAVGDKGRPISERLTAGFRMKDMAAEEQRDWLVQLYRDRNRAAHEGLEVDDDLEVERLLDVTQDVIRYLAVHLIPGHGSRVRACRTFAEAMKCSGCM